MRRGLAARGRRGGGRPRARQAERPGTARAAAPGRAGPDGAPRGREPVGDEGGKAAHTMRRRRKAIR
jgi:hypothetical protein